MRVARTLISFPRSRARKWKYHYCLWRRVGPTVTFPSYAGITKLILLGDRCTGMWTTCAGSHSTAQRPGFEPATGWSQVRHTNHSATEMGKICVFWQMSLIISLTVWDRPIRLLWITNKKSWVFDRSLRWPWLLSDIGRLDSPIYSVNLLRVLVPSVLEPANSVR